jgi:plasmid stability protein
MLAFRRVATLYVRNVPQGVYRSLRARAKENGRSINAEALEILTTAADRARRERPITDRLREIAQEINLPADAPKPEDLIRADRDSR